jgi:hypothetical protein
MSWYAKCHPGDVKGLSLREMVVLSRRVLGKIGKFLPKILSAKQKQENIKKKSPNVYY